MKLKTVIKNIFLISFLILNTCSCYANESVEIQLGNDYLITTDENVKGSFVANPDVVTLAPFFTIFNEKNVLLLHPQKVGKSTFTIFLDKSDVIFDVTIKPSKSKPDTKCVEVSVFEIMPLDEPPNVEELNAPPALIKKGAK